MCAAWQQATVNANFSRQTCRVDGQPTTVLPDYLCVIPTGRHHRFLSNCHFREWRRGNGGLRSERKQAADRNLLVCVWGSDPSLLSRCCSANPNQFITVASRGKSTIFDHRKLQYGAKEAENTILTRVGERLLGASLTFTIKV